MTLADQTCAVLGVSSLSISRWEVEAGRLCTLINVGELAEREERWPQDETYAPADFPLAPAGGGVMGWPSTRRDRRAPSCAPRTPRNTRPSAAAQAR